MKRKTTIVLIGGTLSLLVVGLWAVNGLNTNAKLLLSYLNYASAQTVLPRPTCQPAQVLIPNSYHVEALDATATQQLAVLYSAQCAPTNRPANNVVGIRLYDGLRDGDQV